MSSSGDPYGDGLAGLPYTGSTYFERLAYEQGVRARGGGGGGFPVAILIKLGPPLLGAIAAFWPLASALTYFAAIAALGQLDRLSPDHAFIYTFLVAAVAGALGLVLGIYLETTLQRATVYRVLRHVARLVGFAAVFAYTCLTWKSTTLDLSELTFESVDRQLSVFQYCVIIAGVIAAHFLSLRADRQISMAMMALRLARRTGNTSEGNVAAIHSELASDYVHRQTRLRARLIGALKYGVAGAVVAALLDGGVVGGFSIGFAVGAVIGVQLDRRLARVLGRR
jgi:hypothetical protein